MAQKTYAKVVIADGGPSFEAYRQALEAMAHPGVDVGLLQVGVHEAVLRPHLVGHLVRQNGNVSAVDLLLQAGATRVEMITENAAQALAEQRVEEDLQPRPAAAIPATAGGQRWHLEAINVQPAWDALGGPDAIQWDGVTVGQIDTGYTEHVAFGFAPDGSGGSWLRLADCRTLQYSDVPPEFFVGPPVVRTGDGRDPMPPGALNKGHGTRIGATISGWAQLPGGEMFHGVAPRVPHVMVRITDSVAINTRQREFAEALLYLVDEVQVDVVNVSLGAFPPVASPQMRDAMKNARQKGVIVICAAGNHVDPVVVPAALPTAIAVGGTTWKDRPWHGSSFGNAVAFCAPADEIFRAMPQRDGVGTRFAGGGDGTSYAAAITSGSAALWLRRWRGQIDAMYGRSAVRVEAFRAAVLASCRTPDDWQLQPFGAGIIDTGRLCTDMYAALPALSGG